MFKQTRNTLLALFGAALLAGCGGGSVGNSGSTTGSTTGSTGGVTPATLTLLVSSPQLASDASLVSQGVSLTAIVKDANNNVLPGVTVVFSSADSAEIVVANPASTDANGRVEAILTTGGDPQNRKITVTAAAGRLSKSVAVNVIGTQLDVTGLDSTQINVETPYTISLVDAAGDGIPGQTVAVTTETGNTLSSDTLVTNSAGQVLVKLKPTKAASSITASVLGLTKVKPVTVSVDQFKFTAPPSGTEITAGSEVRIGTTRKLAIQWLQGSSATAVPNGTRVDFRATHAKLVDDAGAPADFALTSGGIATINVRSDQAGSTVVVASSSQLTKPSATLSFEFVAVNPARISVQGVPANVSVNQTSEITATVFDINNNLVKNAIIDFSLDDISGGSLSAPSAITNSQGLARITYTASSQTSASDGVKILGTIRGTSIQSLAKLTVGARAVSIKFGTGADLVVKDTSTYQMPWTVIVQDSSGNPVSDADFSLAIQPINYYKGTRDDAFAGTATECENEDVNLNDILETEDVNGNGTLDSGEDSNGNGVLDSEDVNRNGVLDPGRVASVPRTIDLDPKDGTGQFVVTYPKEFGYFVRLMLIGTVRVGGTETRQSREFLPAVTETDFPRLPFESPYGVSPNCSDAD